MASTIRLWALAEQRGETSPFLHGFTPPLYIQRLTEDEARALINQVQCPSAGRPAMDLQAVESIRQHCDNHPYLLQLVSKRYLEQGELTPAIESVVADEMVSYFFSVDFEMLSSSERAVLQALAGRGVSDSDMLGQQLPMDRSELNGHLQRLESLGYVRRTPDRRFEFSNYFFQRWIAKSPPGASAPEHARMMSGTPPPDRIDAPTHPVLLDGRYRLLSELGKGGAGVVYRAFDVVVRETIAVKVIRPEYSAHPDTLARLRQEIVLTRDLGHPNILRAYHLGESQGQYYITMQLVDGTTLAALMFKEGPLPIGTTIDITRKLASALEAAHSKRILHRDIKPQNILLDSRREPYLSDFGLARLVDVSGLTESGVFLGTPIYASPEQAELRPLDERSDLYSLGTVIYQMATGKTPFACEDVVRVLQMHRTQTPPDPRLLRPDLPSGLSQIILRCLAKDPDRRFQSARELREALEGVDVTC